MHALLLLVSRTQCLLHIPNTLTRRYAFSCTALEYGISPNEFLVNSYFRGRGHSRNSHVKLSGYISAHTYSLVTVRQAIVKLCALCEMTLEASPYCPTKCCTRTTQAAPVLYWELTREN